MGVLSGLGGSVVAAGTVVAGMNEWSLDIGMSPVEGTAFGENWKSFVASVREYSGSFQGNFDNADAAQGGLQAAMLAGSAVALKLSVDGTHYYNVGTALLTKASPKLSHQGKVETGYDFQGSGPLTYV